MGSHIYFTYTEIVFSERRGNLQARIFKINLTLNMLHGNHLGYTRGAIAHLAKPFMILPEEWARGSSVCRASEKGHRFGCPYAHWVGQQMGRQETPDNEGEGRFFTPRPTVALATASLQPPV